MKSLLGLLMLSLTFGVTKPNIVPRGTQIAAHCVTFFDPNLGRYVTICP